jgi:hypothetical protein
VPDWHYSDFDSLYVVTLQQQIERTIACFGWKSSGFERMLETRPGGK